MKHVLSLFVVGCLVAGCETTGLNAEDNGLCKAQLGEPCTSIQQADGTGGLQPYKTFKESPRDKRASQLSQNRLPVANTKVKTTKATIASGAPDGGAPYHVASYRVPERLGSLWLAPHLDDAGLFHEATFVHFVVRGARWGQR